MKKHFRLLSLILIALISAFCLIACSDYGAPSHDTVDPSFAVSTADIETELGNFMSDNIDRTTFTDGEKNAANYLVNRLLEIGVSGDNIDLQEFTANESGLTGLKSQNVIAKIGSSGSGKNVILGAYYDNRYSTAYAGASPDGGQGALAGGTGVATLLTVADYLVNHSSEINPKVNVTVVFFGASYVSDAGAKYFVDKMSESYYNNTVLMVELQRLCGDHLYAFSDARQTEREKFFDRVAAKNRLDVYKPTSQSPLIIGLSALNGVPYYQWAHNGLFRQFFNVGIPTLNIIGANWETANLSDLESADHDNLSYSQNDTLHNLKRYYPDYSKKMATAATLVIRSICDSEFLATMQADRENFPQTDVLNMGWIWDLIVLAVVAAAAGAMAAVNAHLKKKYPIVKPAPPQLKMAVFGMDYEDKNSADIFIDIRNGDDEIFPGIQNNRQKSIDPFDDIFPPSGGRSSNGSGEGGKSDDPFDNPPNGGNGN